MMSSPMITATWQAGALAVASNILGQAITCYQSDRPFAVNYVPLFQYVLYTVLTTPMNFIWQAWLEATFPGYSTKLSGPEKEKLVDDVVAGHSTAAPKSSTTNGRSPGEKSMTAASATQPAKTSRQLNIRNTAIKFALDQTIGAGVNTVLFLAGMPLLRGADRAVMARNVQEEFWPLTFAGQKVWPLVSFLSFTMVPVEYRLVFGSTVGLFWGAYLSMLSGSK